MDNTKNNIYNINMYISKLSWKLNSMRNIAQEHQHSQKVLLQLSNDLIFCQWVVQISQIFWKHILFEGLTVSMQKKNLKSRQHNYVNMEKEQFNIQNNPIMIQSLNIINKFKKRKTANNHVFSVNLHKLKKKNVCMNAFSENLSYQKQTAIVILYKVHYIHIYLPDFKTVKWIIQ